MRANSFGHSPLYLHSKICSRFFSVDFWNGTPETRTALLNFNGCSMADSQVQKAIVSLVALKKRKRMSQFRDETTKVIPCTALTCVKAATIRPAASYSWLSKSCTFKRGIGCIYLSKKRPLFFCYAIPTFSTFFFFHFILLSQFFHFVNDFFDSELMTPGLKLNLSDTRKDFKHLTFNRPYLKASNYFI